MLIKNIDPAALAGANRAGNINALGRAADTPTINSNLRLLQANHVHKRTGRSWTYSKLAAELAFGPMSGGWHHD